MCQALLLNALHILTHVILTQIPVLLDKENEIQRSYITRPRDVLYI